MNNKHLPAILEPHIKCQNQTIQYPITLESNKACNLIEEGIQKHKCTVKNCTCSQIGP